MDKIDHSSRAHALLSASSAHRWLACPPSAAAQALYPDEGSPYAQEGTLAHEVAEAYARRWRDQVPAVFPETATDEMVRHAKEYAAYIAERVTSETAAVILEQRLDFSPWVPGGFGTGDCVILQGNTLDVIDYKYGVGVPVRAERNPQLMLYGLGAWNEYSFVYDIERVRLHIFQPRIDNISTYELTIEELLAWGETVKPVADKAAMGKGEYLPGDHCKFCKHAGKCRALSKVCSTYVNTHGLRVKVPVLAPHEVAEALQMEPLVTLWLKRVREQALTDMLNGEHVPGFKVVEGKQGNRRWTDETAVLEVLEAAGLAREDVTETKLLSPAAMDKALGKRRAADLHLDGFTERSPGAPTIAPESDKRAPYDRLAEAQNDFK